MQGNDLHSMFSETSAERRLGNRALIITGPEEFEDGSLYLLQREMQKSGIDGVVCDAAGRLSKSDAAAEAASLLLRSKAQWALGLGDPSIQGLAKAATLLARMDGAGYTMDDFLDNRVSAVVPPGSLYPYLAVPTQCWNPLIYTDLAAVTDSRDRGACIISTGVYADAVFHSAEITSLQTEKQLVYDLVCILVSVFESLSQSPNTISRPLLNSALTGALEILRQIPSSETPVESGIVQSLGLLSSRAGSVSPPGPGFACGRAVLGLHDIEAQWTTAALLPGIAAISSRRGAAADGSLRPFLIELLGIEETDESEDTEYTVGLIEDEIRALTGRADVPLRLHDLGLDNPDLPRIKTIAADLCGEEPELLAGLLEAAL